MASQPSPPGPRQRQHDIMDPLITTLGIQPGIAGWKLLRTKAPADFPALAKDPVIQREIAYFRQHAPKALTAKDLLADRRLQDFALTAFGMKSQIGMTGLMRKVLESDPGDKSSFAGRMVDARFAEIARAFQYGVPATPATPAQPSVTEVRVDRLFRESNFESFRGTFGGITVDYLPLTTASTGRALAESLQAAFRRADGNRQDISVTFDGQSLRFADAKGRGAASGFAWTDNPRNTAGPPSLAAPVTVSAGRVAGPVTGGPAVSDVGFIDQVVRKYQEAQFEAVIGNTSNALREARYAQRKLPEMTNWYSVIADRPLANVMQTVLGLGESFGKLDVDQQARMLGRRMDIKDFQDPAKLATLLTRYVAMSEQQNQSTASIALQLLDRPRGNGFINVTLPGMTSDVRFSSASAAAMILGSAFR